MKIALDYDLTYTLDPVFWAWFAEVSKARGFDVRIVTARSPTLDNIDDRVNIPIIYCDGVAKKFVCTHFAKWLPDIWIDDKPSAIDYNSTATPEFLEEWRSTREH